MAKKKELYDVGMHPNAGMVVSIYLKNRKTGTESRKDGMWNGTHWLIVGRKNNSMNTIPSEQELIGWSE